MGRHIVKLPDIGEGIAESEIAAWHVAVGDRVAEDQPLVDMLTEKAAVELPSPKAGTVVELHGAPGDMIAVGSALVTLEIEGEDPGGEDAGVAPEAKPPPPPSGEVTATPAEAAAATPPPETALPQRAPAAAVPRRPGERPLASPAVRRRAQELGVELQYVPGSGPAGRITHADLDAYLDTRGSGAAGARAPSRAPRTEVESIKVIGLRRRIAEAMQRAKQRIPHFAYVEEVDVTELEALRVHLNAARRDDQPKLTLLPFLLRALVQVLPRYPQVNATYDDEAGVVHRHAAVHCGIATQTPNGLVVPVLRHAETLDVWQMATGIRLLAEAVRSGKATRETLSGSSITITSLGALGGIVSTPVINAPEVAIVGVNRMVERPVYLRGQLVPRLMMNLSSSFDHRIVDGYDAAAFIQAVKVALEHPATLFMEASA
ncbi:MAG: dihydrolipoamide acetyltransferase family protein [Nevskiales bacterium]|nr:dihydrolipoamide acetyltransferase family protein [Nevskiales bacterium]